MRRLRELSEQFESIAGYEKSARDLTWELRRLPVSYAAAHKPAAHGNLTEANVAAISLWLNQELRGLDPASLRDGV
jgi:hypothetical protein